MERVPFKIDAHDPLAVSARSGGGKLTLFGLGSIAIGAISILIGLGVINPGEGNDTNPLWPLIWGAVFIGMGLWWALRRSGLIADGRARTVTAWSGALLPMRKRTMSFDDVREVSIKKERRGGGRRSYIANVVRVEPRDPAAGAMEFVAAADYGAAREGAERLARLIGVDLADHTSGKIVRRPAAKLGQRLKDRPEQDAPPKAPAPADDPGIEVAATPGERIEIRLPAGPSPGFFSAAVAVPLVASFAAFAAALVMVARVENMPASAKHVYAAGMALVLVVLPLATAYFYRRKQSQGGVSIVIDRERLVFRERTVYVDREVAIPLGEIEDVIYYDPEREFEDWLDAGGEEAERIPGRGREASVTIVGARARVEIGGGRAPDTLESLHNLLKESVVNLSR